jgi:hypothetical protein
MEKLHVDLLEQRGLIIVCSIHYPYEDLKATSRHHPPVAALNCCVISIPPKVSRAALYVSASAEWAVAAAQAQPPIASES